MPITLANAISEWEYKSIRQRLSERRNRRAVEVWFENKVLFEKLKEQKDQHNQLNAELKKQLKAVSRLNYEVGKLNAVQQLERKVRVRDHKDLTRKLLLSVKTLTQKVQKLTERTEDLESHKALLSTQVNAHVNNDVKIESDVEAERISSESA